MLVVVIAPALNERVHLRPFVLFDRNDRVERLTGCVDADIVDQRLGARFLDYFRHREHFGDRLDRNFRRHIAGRIHLTVGRHQHDAVDARIDFRERRNVVGVLAFLQIHIFRVCRAERRIDGFLCEGVGCACAGCSQQRQQEGNHPESYSWQRHEVLLSDRGMLTGPLR